MFFAKESLATQCYQCVADGASTFCNDPFNPNQYGVIKCEDKTCYKGTSYIAGGNFVVALSLIFINYEHLLRAALKYITDILVSLQGAVADSWWIQIDGRQPCCSYEF